MKHIINTIGAVLLILTMALSSVIVTSAETVEEKENTSVVTIEETKEESRAYELVWKFKEEYNHLWKRRWNRTLGGWYDPDWILVY